jgi:23S rRNA (pseudouridine1915-N3)-methyltransferase
MKFRFVWIGKTKQKDWKALQEEYLGRLSHFVRCEIVDLKDTAVGESVETEGNRIISSLNPSTFVCLLDVKGRSVTSKELAAQVENWQNGSIKEVTFVIGGASGVSSEVAAKADYRLSLSFLTFTHEMARVVLLEQLYRAHTIIRGFPYKRYLRISRKSYSPNANY